MCYTKIIFIPVICWYKIAIALSNIKNVPYKIYVHPNLNSSRPDFPHIIIDIDDLYLFKAVLNLNYNVEEIVPAPFNKTKFTGTKSFMATFGE